ncbi:hypothetical protein PS914_03230 [Pseudomonas fluorescens]|uniref:Rap1a/Tai family immunity protein n=1 Tax=Pseudomonas fluorescens TaxID=294 RepID=UPI00123FC9D5|nr:Rap1a/Tai family immunity protein [Pseudomonas fluorescens]VVP92142.1 hypothetical protein PS914_03230 [Pseudomonas fluorescens]
MKMWIAVIALAGTLTGGVAEAALSDGNRLLKACRLVVKFADGEQIPSNQNVEFGYCLGLMAGVSGTMMLHNDLLQPADKICFPLHNISNEQSARIVVKYLGNHPEELDKPSAFLAFLAYAEAYPCK